MIRIDVRPERPSFRFAPTQRQNAETQRIRVRGSQEENAKGNPEFHAKTQRENQETQRKPEEICGEVKK
jgi:hypothetical protein